MAIYHCSIKNGGRAKGQSAVAASAYRSGEKLTDKETGLISDYTRKSGIVYSEVSLCQNAPTEYANREILWNAVHKIEKASNARLWREIEVALPKELDRAEQIKTVKQYVKGLTDRGMCADWSLHDKGDGNPHAHIMLTTRSIKENGAWAPKSRKVYDLDENGERIYLKTDKNGRKQYKNHKEDFNDWNAPERVEEWREEWAVCCNQRLEAEEKIDHRSYLRQGIEKEPTIHEGYVARKIQSKGDISERCIVNVEIQNRNSLLARVLERLNLIAIELSRLSVLAEKEKEERKKKSYYQLKGFYRRTDNFEDFICFRVITEDKTEDYLTNGQYIWSNSDGKQAQRMECLYPVGSIDLSRMIGLMEKNLPNDRVLSFCKALHQKQQEPQMNYTAPAQERHNPFSRNMIKQNAKTISEKCAEKPSKQSLSLEDRINVAQQKADKTNSERNTAQNKNRKRGMHR